MVYLYAGIALVLFVQDLGYLSEGLTISTEMTANTNTHIHTHKYSSSRGGKRGGGVMTWFGIVGNVSTSLSCFSTASAQIYPALHHHNKPLILFSCITHINL